MATLNTGGKTYIINDRMALRIMTRIRHENHYGRWYNSACPLCREMMRDIIAEQTTSTESVWPE